MRVRWFVLVFGFVAVAMLLGWLILPGLVSTLPKQTTAAAAATVPDAAATSAASPSSTAPAADTPAGSLLAEIRALLPKRLDRVTTFADARASADGFTFVFLFPFLKGEVDDAQLADLLKAKVKSGFCSDAYVKRIFDLGQGVDLVFHTADGSTAYQQRLNKGDCA